MKKTDAFFNMILNQYREKDAKAKQAGQPQPGIPLLTASSLRLEQFINANQTQYLFPVLSGQVGNGSSQVLPTEVRLEQNDNFHISDIGFYLGVTNASTDVNFRLQTNNNEIFLGGAAPALNYGTLWNGIMTITVNQVNVLTNYRLSKHFVVNQTQRLSAAANNNFDQINLENDGLVPLHPSIMLSGAYTNLISITLPSAITSALANNNSRMVLIFDGLRAQNAAVRKGSL